MVNPVIFCMKAVMMMLMISGFKSRVFQFIDDLELFLDPLNGIISIRSAARTGYWDFGVNRRRVEQLRHALQGGDLIHHP